MKHFEGWSHFVSFSEIRDLRGEVRSRPLGRSNDELEQGIDRWLENYQLGKWNSFVDAPENDCDGLITPEEHELQDILHQNLQRLGLSGLLPPESSVDNQDSKSYASDDAMSSLSLAGDTAAPDLPETEDSDNIGRTPIRQRSKAILRPTRPVVRDGIVVSPGESRTQVTIEDAVAIPATPHTPTVTLHRTCQPITRKRYITSYTATFAENEPHRTIIGGQNLSCISVSRPGCAGAAKCARNGWKYWTQIKKAPRDGRDKEQRIARSMSD
ncbi:hypothetical protein F5Y15DRAFT_416469 [Xylariaceae sp. FL0016]|nr:hypothetical protein F5Y15DRAFT_416469 [Xylariaceae sp. FL0016]